MKEISSNLFEVKVSVPPEKGKANAKVIEVLSAYFGVSKSKVNILSGNTGREKLIEIL